MFGSVLVANRGEIAVRIMRTLRRLDIESIAIFSDADRDALHVRQADRSVRVGPPAARDSYLAIGAIVAAARATGAEAVHPGYGFLSENPDFAAACQDAGLVFVGPPVAAIAAMGDKIPARKLASEAGVPVVPGRDDPAMTDDDLVAAAQEIGFPVLLKPSAGGGGKGMRLVHAASELGQALHGARRESLASFGDDTLFVERYIERPRHIEVQVLADNEGNTAQLFERECSLQRRHQKIVEETPSPVINAATRAALGDHAITVAKACGYVGAGTVEFVVPSTAPDEHFFLEMNTRLQVEHPVTEMVLGLDLVEWQLRIAAGEPLSFDQTGVVAHGHAIEARVYAEDPKRGFLPTGGTVLQYREPTDENVRVDSGIESGSVVTALYDPMLAKVIAWGPERESARSGLVHALEETSVLGVRTNLAYLAYLLEDPAVRAGALDTGLAERILSDFRDASVDDGLVAAAALSLMIEDEPHGPVVDSWSVPGGSRVPVRRGRRARSSSVRASDMTFASVGGRDPPRSRSVARNRNRRARSLAQGHSSSPLVTSATPYLHAPRGGESFLGCGPSWWSFRVVAPYAGSADRALGATDGTVRSPMPGSVVAVEAQPGDRVEAGDVLVVVEAMKMEHTVVAPISGQIAEVHVAVGDRVGIDEEVVAIEQDGIDAGASEGDSTDDGKTPSERTASQ